MSHIKSLKEDLGQYLPSFFRIKLEFPHPPDPMSLYNLSKRNQATFVHEYIHYLQDVSTYFGLNNAYFHSEYIHAAVNEVYSMPNNEAHIPIELQNNVGNVELNGQIQELATGYSGEIPNLFLLKIDKENRKPKYHHPYCEYLTQIILRLPKGENIVFGGKAIMESMAYLIERNVEPSTSGADDYPYHAAEYVAREIYPGFVDDIRLIALCDISLNCSNPGKMFVQTLEMYKSCNRIPTPENIYEDFYKAPCRMMGRDTTYSMGFLPFAIQVTERLVLYLNDNRFGSFHNTLRKMIGSGMDYRVNHKTFMIDIARGGDLLHNEPLRMVMRRFGSPVIVDSIGNHSQLESYMFKSHELYIFFAIQQVYETLSNGQFFCEMRQWCDYPDENGKATVNTDDRCDECPWSRAYDNDLCPYALLWRHWKLGDRKVINHFFDDDD